MLDTIAVPPRFSLAPQVHDLETLLAQQSAAFEAERRQLLEKIELLDGKTRAQRDRVKRIGEWFGLAAMPSRLIERLAFSEHEVITELEVGCSAKAMKVHASVARRRLERHGVTIGSVRRIGYYMPKVDREQMQEWFA